MQKHYLDLFQLVLLGLDSIHFLAQGLTEKQQQKTQWIPWTTQAASMQLRIGMQLSNKTTRILCRDRQCRTWQQVQKILKRKAAASQSIETIISKYCFLKKLRRAEMAQYSTYLMGIVHSGRTEIVVLCTLQVVQELYSKSTVQGTVVRY